jgi:hypothetical protein
MNRKEILDLLIDSLGEDVISELRLRSDVKKAQHTTDIVIAKKKAAINFGEWLLLHEVKPGINDDLKSSWYIKNFDKYEYFTTSELYGKYISGEWDKLDSDF